MGKKFKLLKLTSTIQFFQFVKVPVLICILLILGFLYMGAFAFSDWENWPMSTAFYFCFISLATIGFGDKVSISPTYDEQIFSTVERPLQNNHLLTTTFWGSLFSIFIAQVGFEQRPFDCNSHFWGYLFSFFLAQVGFGQRPFD